METTEKITFAAWVRTNNKFQIIIMGHGDSLSYFILSWFPLRLFRWFDHCNLCLSTFSFFSVHFVDVVVFKLKSRRGMQKVVPGRPDKVFIWEKVVPPTRVTLPINYNEKKNSKGKKKNELVFLAYRGDTARSPSCLASPETCCWSSCNGSLNFSMKKSEKLARPV